MGVCHVTCGALFFFSDYILVELLLSDDIMSRAKKPIRRFSPRPRKPACRTGQGACDRSLKDFGSRGRWRGQRQESEIKPSIPDALAARGKSFPARNQRSRPRFDETMLGGDVGGLFALRWRCCRFRLANWKGLANSIRGGVLLCSPSPSSMSSHKGAPALRRLVALRS